MICTSCKTGTDIVYELWKDRECMEALCADCAIKEVEKSEGRES